MLNIFQGSIYSETDMLKCSSLLAPLLKGGDNIYLHGLPGAGKTAFVRGLLRALNVTGIVKSPTYTLVETYFTTLGTVHHIDLYRIADPEEIEYLGGRDLWSDNSLRMVEWPENGAGWLPEADLNIRLKFIKNGRSLSIWSKNHPDVATIATNFSRHFPE